MAEKKIELTSFGAKIVIGSESYPAYTIEEWRRQFGKAFQLNNYEHIVSCCRKQPNSNSINNRLPDDWDCIKADRWYIYSIPQKRQRHAVPSWEKIKLDEFMQRSLRSYQYMAMLTGREVKFEGMFSANGCVFVHAIHDMNPPQIQIVSTFVQLMQLQLIGEYYKAMGRSDYAKRWRREAKQLLPVLGNNCRQYCLWCGKHKLESGKVDLVRHRGLFHNQQCDEKFRYWCNTTIKSYMLAVKLNSFTPSKKKRSPMFPELLDHPVIDQAINDRVHVLMSGLS